MNAKLNIPEKIKVGFRKRSDTYSGLLAYVVYLKSDGTTAKEGSWNGWIDSKIPVKELQNEPTEGFVLNKKAGGYASGWNHRQTYCRVWDPRGWEFEISIENLLFILQECNCDKGKGLEGKFVYSWSGKDLVLLPTSSQDYKDSLTLIKKTEKIGVSNLILGSSYRSKDDKNLVYVGSRAAYNPSVGKFRQHLFSNNDKVIGFKNVSDKFYYKTADNVLTLEKCSDFVDSVKDRDKALDRGVKVIGFDIKPDEPVMSVDDITQEILKKCQDEFDIKIKEFLSNPTIEAYEKLQNISGTRNHFNYYKKLSDTSWAKISCGFEIGLLRNHFLRRYLWGLGNDEKKKQYINSVIGDIKKLSGSNLRIEGMDYRIDYLYQLEGDRIVEYYNYGYRYREDPLFKTISTDSTDTAYRLKDEWQRGFNLIITLSDGTQIERKYHPSNNYSEYEYR